MDYVYVNGELYHHGIKGQKWGVRRWQNADGTFNEAGKKRYFGDGESSNSVKGAARRALAKVYETNEKYYSKHGNKLMASMNKHAKEQQLKKAAEADKVKQNKINATKEAVGKYNKAFEKANKTQEKADAAASEMRAAYKDLGKTKISRFAQAFKGTIGKGSEAYERYSKAYDKANKTQETADSAYREMRSAFQETGKNYASRVLNNIKYDPDRK